MCIMAWHTVGCLFTIQQSVSMFYCCWYIYIYEIVNMVVVSH